MFDAWRDGVFGEIAHVAESYVSEHGLKEHSHLRAVNSSQAFAFNLFFPFTVDATESLATRIGHHLGREVRVERIDFEFRDSEDLLGEWAGTSPGPDEPHTTSDVAAEVTDLASGERGGVLMEVKLSEREFTPCKGATSRGNRTKDACALRSRFFEAPERCYLRRTWRATTDRRYWEIFRRQTGSPSLLDAFPRAESEECPFRGGHQQIMRNHALALGLVQAGRWAFSAFGLIHHDENPDVVPAWNRYAAMTSLPGLFRMPASEVLRCAPGTGWWPEWCAYVRERYDLLT